MTDHNGIGGEGRSNTNDNDLPNEAYSPLPAVTSHSPEDSIEKAFGLLKEAKSLECKEEYWKAAEIYIQAQQLLQALSDEASRTAAVTVTTTTSKDDDNNDSNDKDNTHQHANEQEQIACLYRDKAQEYWSQSRYCLIQAMQREKKIDEEEFVNNNHPKAVVVAKAVSAAGSTTRPFPLPPLTCNLIDDDQAKSRNQTFTALFSRPILEEKEEEVLVDKNAQLPESQKSNHNDNNNNILDQQWSIEERLQALNKSLPSGFKTDEERMMDINRGLNKLGLSLYAQKQPFARFQDDLKIPQSEEEQIEEIMAQAQEEVALAKNSHSKMEAAASKTITNDDDDDDDDMSEEEDDENEKGDEMLEDDQLAIKTIRKKLIKAQIKITELVALLDEVKIAKDTEYMDNHKEEVTMDDSSTDEHDDVTKSDAAALWVPGKKKLKSAQRNLKKALEEWNDALLVVNQATANRVVGNVPTNQSILSLVKTDNDSDDDEAPELIALMDDTPGIATGGAHPVTNKDIDISLSVESTTKTLPPCPVTILSGFLGSGKTTLIQYILKSPDHGKRIAVIENEFGEGLAVESLIARDGVDPQSDSLQDLIELPNGCICCTVKDSLVATLENLLNKRHDLDYILIEASGMANPGPIASVFWLDDALESRLKLDGIVTLVDGVHILEQLKTTQEAALQIAYADRIVLNKVDLLEQRAACGGITTKQTSSVEDVESKLRQIHPTAPILRTSFSKIPNLDWILNADCFGGANRLEELEKVWENADSNVDETTRNLDHSHQHDHQRNNHDDCEHCHANHIELQHHHTASISTIALHESGSVDLVKLNSWLADVLWPNQDETDQVLTAMLHHSTPNDEKEMTTTSSIQISSNLQEDGTQQQIFRMKGILSAYFQDEEDVDDTKDCSVYRLDDSGLDRRRFILQAVHDLWEVYPASDNLMFQSDEERVGKVVVIGKFLKEEELRSGFQRCFGRGPLPS